MQNRHMSVSSFVDDKSIGSPSAAAAAVSTTPNASGGSAEHLTHAQIEGYLFKRTSKGFKSWNRRWFYLCDNQLVYK